MEYEVMEAKKSVGGDTWNVSAIGPDGEIYVAVFSGPGAQGHAIEYVRFKNGMPHIPAAELAR